MRIVYAGLDVGSTSCHLFAIDEKGGEVVSQKIDTSEKNLIEAFKKLRGEVHVHLESSEMTAWVREILLPLVKRVVVGHAKTNAWIAKDPHKKDKVDAAKLAHLLRMGQVHEVYYDEHPDRHEFKQIVRHYEDLTRQRATVKIKIKSRFRVQGVVAVGRSVFGPDGRKRWLAEVKSEEARMSIERLFTLLDFTTKLQKDARDQMSRLAKKYPEIERFLDVPGVGLIGACRFSAYLQTPHRFSAKRKLWRYCGLAVTDRSSDGKPLGRQRLDPTGNRRLKGMASSAFFALNLTRRDNLFKRTYQQVLKRTKDKTHARLTTERKILSVLWAMWRDNTKYQDEGTRPIPEDTGKVR